MEKEENHAPQTLSDRLRKAGFVRLPPLWVRRHEMKEILEVTNRSAVEVNAHRQLASQEREQHSSENSSALPALAPAKKTKGKKQGFVVQKKRKFSIHVTAPEADPRTSKEAAWAAYQSSKR